jgi:hypothetical protein
MLQDFLHVLNPLSAEWHLALISLPIASPFKLTPP